MTVVHANYVQTGSKLTRGNQEYPIKNLIWAVKNLIKVINIETKQGDDDSGVCGYHLKTMNICWDDKVVNIRKISSTVSYELKISNLKDRKLDFAHAESTKCLYENLQYFWI